VQREGHSVVERQVEWKAIGKLGGAKSRMHLCVHTVWVLLCRLKKKGGSHVSGFASLNCCFVGGVGIALEGV
jgi:hypothetical protein